MSLKQTLAILRLKMKSPRTLKRTWGELEKLYVEAKRYRGLFPLVKCGDYVALYRPDPKWRTSHGAPIICNFMDIVAKKI
jgi:hypothetical protein